MFVVLKSRTSINRAQSAGEVLVRLTELAAMAARQEIHPLIDRTYALADGADAVRYLEVEHARGKVVVSV